MTTPRQLTPMQEKVAAAKREHVLDAALAVFASKGFRGATVHDVAKAAGVADGTIYNLFENKAALLHGILLGQPDGAVDSNDLSGVSDAALPMRALIRVRWEALNASKLAMLRVVLSEALIDPDFRHLYRETLLTPAIEQLKAPLAMVTESGSAALDARLVTGLFLGLVMLKLLDDPMLESSDDQIADSLSDFVAGGLGLPRGKAGGL